VEAVPSGKQAGEYGQGGSAGSASPARPAMKHVSEVLKADVGFLTTCGCMYTASIVRWTGQSWRGKEGWCVRGSTRVPGPRVCGILDSAAPVRQSEAFVQIGEQRTQVCKLGGHGCTENAIDPTLERIT
jgi:hypothetical protein